MGSNIHSALEKAELRDRDFFLGRKLKFGQETETKPPMPVKFTQRGSKLFWVLFVGAEPQFLSWQPAESGLRVHCDVELSIWDQKRV